MVLVHVFYNRLVTLMSWFMVYAISLQLFVVDDTVLEEHYEDPALVQIRLIGDRGKTIRNRIQYTVHGIRCTVYTKLYTKHYVDHDRAFACYVIKML